MVSECEHWRTPRHGDCSAFESFDFEKEGVMPEKETLQRAAKDRREGKSPSTQAGEFVREEMHHIREGKHGATSPEQAIAIGLSKARRAGVPLKAPKPGTTSAKTRRSAQRAIRAGKKHKKASPTRSRAIRGVLKHEGHSAASPKARRGTRTRPRCAARAAPGPRLHARRRARAPSADYQSPGRSGPLRRPHFFALPLPWMWIWERVRALPLPWERAGERVRLL
jgi:hypothetical protein